MCYTIVYFALSNSGDRSENAGKWAKITRPFARLLLRGGFVLMRVERTLNGFYLGRIERKHRRENRQHLATAIVHFFLQQTSPAKMSRLAHIPAREM